MFRPDGHTTGETTPGHQPQFYFKTHPGGILGINVRSIFHGCYLFELAVVLELTKETIYLSLGCLQGGPFTCKVDAHPNNTPKVMGIGALCLRTYVSCAPRNSFRRGPLRLQFPLVTCRGVSSGHDDVTMTLLSDVMCAEDVLSARLTPWLSMIHAHVPSAHVVVACTRWETPSEGLALDEHQARLRPPHPKSQI